MILLFDIGFLVDSFFFEHFECYPYLLASIVSSAKLTVYLIEVLRMHDFSLPTSRIFFVFNFSIFTDLSVGPSAFILLGVKLHGCFSLSLGSFQPVCFFLLLSHFSSGIPILHTLIHLTVYCFLDALYVFLYSLSSLYFG